MEKPIMSIERIERMPRGLNYNVKKLKSLDGTSDERKGKKEKQRNASF